MTFSYHAMHISDKLHEYFIQEGRKWWTCNTY